MAFSLLPATAPHVGDHRFAVPTVSPVQRPVVPQAPKVW
jgi:hypothetical protein